MAEQVDRPRAVVRAVDDIDQLASTTTDGRGGMHVDEVHLDSLAGGLEPSPDPSLDVAEVVVGPEGREAEQARGQVDTGDAHARQCS
jgi:hypothetical protein